MLVRLDQVRSSPKTPCLSTTCHIWEGHRVSAMSTDHINPQYSVVSMAADEQPVAWFRLCDIGAVYTGSTIATENIADDATADALDRLCGMEIARAGRDVPELRTANV